MNAQRFRLVFNRSRGILMAVAECVSARCKSAGSRSSPLPRPAMARWAPLAFAVFSALGGSWGTMSIAHAQVVAYRNSPASQRPTILNAGNGITLVNIQTPSAAGVSRNTYEQFDVQAQGAILNNSRVNTQTQLGGWVQGNPWLAAGTARVILNEVISANPSQLLGFIEVAGSSAQVVIANPAGLTCNGCGFINASRATLTTGTPILNGGNLDGYRVEDGVVRIEGGGMDASRVGYTDIIARAVQINAGLWAQTLAVTTGSNTVDAGNTQVTPIAGSGAAPGFAIDVAQLGGMYAGKITLRGTEAGVGVRNAGKIGGGVGEIAVTVDGQLVNTGVISGNNARLVVDTLNNLGGGKIYGDHLAIAANTLNNRDAGGESPVIGARIRLDLGVGTLNNRNDDTTTSDAAATRIFSEGDIAIGGGLDADNHATGNAVLVHNHGATIEASGNLTVRATDIRNTNAGFVVETIQESSRFIQEVQPEGWADRHDVSFFPSIFNHGVEAQPYVVDGAVVARFEDYTFYQYTASTSVTSLVSSRAGRIIAGGNATFAGNLENDNSRILAGDTLNHTVGILNNISTPGVRTTAYSGWVQFRDWDGRDEELEFGRVYPFSPAPDVSHFDLGIARVDGSAGPAIGAAPADLGSLYSINPTANYLIETDPQFAGYRQWLSSDYMLQQLASDPATRQKRLGDGYYEQRLVNEQVAQLTGRRFLDGHASDEAQYRALMDAGLTVARDWQLVPGVALAAEQVARLTTDIVWLVEKTVSLPGGETQKVLVPQLYARLRDGDLSPGGGLLSAGVIQIAGGDVTNSGTIAGRQLVTLSADSIKNLGGSISGAAVELTSGKDIEMRGGRLAAENRLSLTAGGDIDIASTTRSSEHREGSGEFTRTNVERVAALYVGKADGQLKLAALGDVGLSGAQMQSGGSIRVDAGGNLALSTVAVAEKNHTGEGKNHNKSGASSEIGTRIAGQGDVILTAGDTLSARAAEVSSERGALAVRGDDIAIRSGEASSYTDIAQTSRRKGTFSSKTKSQRDAFADTTAIASTFSGETVSLVAEGDIGLKGSNVVATKDTVLAAGNDLSIEAATETHSETHFLKVKKSGVFASGASLTIGKQQMSTDQNTESTRAAKSSVGSLEGDVTLLAGNRYRQVGSDVIVPKGDIEIAAKTVDIVEARETDASRFEQKSKQSGLTVSISNPVISAVQTVQQMTEAAGNTSDGRMKALAAASAALSGYNAYSAVAAGQGKTVKLTNGTVKDNQIVTETNAKGEAVASRDATALDKVGGINVSISLGSSKSKSTSTQKRDSAAGSELLAGGDIRVTAGGAGTASDITLRGAQVTAGKNVTLTAEDEINLLAAANTAEMRSSNKSSSASVGVSVGTSSGFAITAAASRGKGKANGDDLSWSNTRVEAGDTLTLNSGGDTALKGAIAAADRVVARVGGDLAIESLQDVSTYDSKQSSSGFSISIPITGFSLTGISGSISASKSKIESDFRSVAEQSGLRAGDGGFDVQVGQDTTLTGGAITSTQKAIDAEKNRFSTGGQLSLSNLENKAEYEAKGGSINLGASLSLDGKLGPQGTGAGYGEDSGNASSTTLAAISDIAGNKAARTGDAETGLKPIFDAAKVQKEIDAQVRITQTFGQLAPKAAADFAGKQAADLREQAKQESDPARKAELQNQAKQWDEGGVYRVALHTALGGLAGGTSGALGAGASASAAPLLNELQDSIVERLKDAGAGDAVAKLAGQLISGATAAGIGAVAGGAQGATTAFNTDANNRQLHPREIDLIKAKTRDFMERMKREGYTLTEAQATKILTENAADQVDFFDQSTPNGANPFLNAQAKQFLQEIGQAAGSFTDNRGLQINYFTTQTSSGQVLAGDFINPTRYADLYNSKPYQDFAYTNLNRNLLGSSATPEALRNYINRENDQNKRAMAAAMLLAGGGGTALAVKLAPRILAAGSEFISACAANPALCMNQLGLTAAEIGLGEALPVGLGVGTANILANKLANKARPEQVEQIAARLSSYTPDEMLAINAVTAYKDGNRNSAEAVNAYLNLTAGAQAPYMPGTVVRDVVAQPGQKLYIIENLTATGPGGWAGTRVYTDINEARRELALLPEFKNPNEIIVDGKATLNDIVIREYTVKQPLPTRQGMVGPQAEYFKNTQGQTILTGQTYPGGGKQVELLIDTKGLDTKGALVWESYLNPHAQYKIGDRTLTPHPVVRKAQC